MLKKFKQIMQHNMITNTKNIYSCKIVALGSMHDFIKPTEIQYTIGEKNHLHNANIGVILNNPSLIEGFSSLDGIILGFLACGDILLKEELSLEQARRLYLQTAQAIFYK